VGPGRSGPERRRHLCHPHHPFQHICSLRSDLPLPSAASPSQAKRHQRQAQPAGPHPGVPRGRVGDHPGEAHYRGGDRERGVWDGAPRLPEQAVGPDGSGGQEAAPGPDFRRRQAVPAGDRDHEGRGQTSERAVTRGLRHEAGARNAFGAAPGGGVLRVGGSPRVPAESMEANG